MLSGIKFHIADRGLTGVEFPGLAERSVMLRLNPVHEVRDQPLCEIVNLPPIAVYAGGRWIGGMDDLSLDKRLSLPRKPGNNDNDWPPASPQPMAIPLPWPSELLIQRR